VKKNKREKIGERKEEGKLENRRNSKIDKVNNQYEGNLKSYIMN
jgi:hypothetical protein